MNKSGVTLGVLQELQQKYRVTASKALGQNFLVDANISRKIAEAIEPDQNVIEVGPGIGSLTVPLARRSNRVIAIEFDAHILDPLNEVLTDFEVSEKVEVIHSDVMEVELQKLCLEKDVRTIIGNLPYNISAPLLADIAIKTPVVETVVAMVQREVGERLAAKQGTRAVSSITLKCQYFMDIKVLFDVPSQSFIPRPRVDSVVVSMSRHDRAEPLKTDAIKEMFSMIDMAFSQRRKMMRQSLKSMFGSDVAEIFELSGVAPTIRPEQCTLDDFLNVYRAYKNVSS